MSLKKLSKLSVSLLAVLLILSAYSALPFISHAQTSGPLPGSQSGTRGPLDGSGQPPISIKNPLQAENFSELINKIANWLLVLGAPVLTLMIIIGAFQILSAAGNPEKVKTGRQTITWAIVGYALLLISTGITALIKNVLSVN